MGVFPVPHRNMSLTVDIGYHDNRVVLAVARIDKPVMIFLFDDRTFRLLFENFGSRKSNDFWIVVS